MTILIDLKPSVALEPRDLLLEISIIPSKNQAFFVSLIVKNNYIRKPNMRYRSLWTCIVLRSIGGEAGRRFSINPFVVEVKRTLLQNTF